MPVHQCSAISITHTLASTLFCPASLGLGGLIAEHLTDSHPGAGTPSSPTRGSVSVTRPDLSGTAGTPSVATAAATDEAVVMCVWSVQLVDSHKKLLKISR